MVLQFMILPTKRLLQVIIQKALITLDAERGSLMLYDYSINALQVRIVSGLQDKKLEEAINNHKALTSLFLHQVLLRLFE